MNPDEKAIAAVLTSYQDALNRSDTETVMKLYAPDGVFMPQHFTSSVGADAILSLMVPSSRPSLWPWTSTSPKYTRSPPDWAIARTNSAGATKINATGKRGAEANQELFVFQKIGDAWKIARYCFSTTNPPPHG